MSQGKAGPEAIFRRLCRELFGQISPWDCAFCDEKVILLCDRDVHHLNGDHSDNRPENLATVHHSCHARHHRTGFQMDEDQLRIHKEIRVGKKHSPETREKMRKAQVRRRNREMLGAMGRLK